MTCSDTRPINSVWSSFGHRFMSDGESESCLTCGAMFDLVATPEGMSDGAYVNARGDEPSECSHMTNLVHGLHLGADLGPDDVDAQSIGCNCNFCTA